MLAEYHITEDEYVQAMRLHAKLSTQRIWWFGTLFGALGLCVIFVSPSVRPIVAGFMFALVCIVPGTIYIAVPIMAHSNFRKYRRGDDRSAVELLPRGVRFVSADADVTMTWSKVIMWRQNNSYILLYQTPRLYLMIPKSVAAAGFDLPELISQLEVRVGHAV